MPKIKANPRDIIRLPDVIAMLKKVSALAESGEPLYYSWIDKKKKRRKSKVWVNYWETSCLIAILFLFGKRISEVLTIKRKDVWVKRGYLYVRFGLLKKKSKTLDERASVIKRIHLEKSHKISRFVIGHVKEIPDAEAYIFQGNSRPHIQVVRNKKLGKIYRYKHDTKGNMSRIHAYKILKALNPEYYPHYFRKSLATLLAEEHTDPIALKMWFDWERFDTAMKYIQKSGVITEQISNREI